MSQSGRLVTTGGGGGGDVLTLTADVGGAVSPDAGGNINVLGGSNINTSGNPGTNTIMVNLNDFISWPATSAIAGYIEIDGDIFMHNYQDNTFLGTSAGNLTMGVAAVQNVGIGQLALESITDAVGNVAIGFQAGQDILDSLQSTIIGYQSGTSLTSGSRNLLLGRVSGSNYTIENDNIVMLNSGTPGDSGVIRIGTNLVQTSAFIQGIWNVAPVGANQVVTINASGQLGTSSAIAGLYTVQTLNATPTPIFTYPLAQEQAITIKAIIVGQRSNFQYGGGGEVTYGAQTPSVGNALQTLNFSNFDDNGPVGVDIAVGGQIVGTNVQIFVQGIAAQTWNWTAQVSFVVQT